MNSLTVLALFLALSSVAIADPELLIRNNCPSRLFIEARQSGGMPLPPPASQSSTLTPLLYGQSVGYTIPDAGLSSTRFWAKFGCDDNGKNCDIGDQQQFFKDQGCPPQGCTPAIDSLFEATWGCKGAACPADAPGYRRITYWDTSQVDGYTIPYKVTVSGNTAGCVGTTTVDASNLDLSQCPQNEDVSAINWPTYNGKNLKSTDLTLRVNNTIYGCMSPCAKLTTGGLYGNGLNPAEGPALWMCCPAALGTANPSKTCNDGPVTKTQYVAAIHRMVPTGVYAFSYDDEAGTHTCGRDVVYTMEFCPAGSKPYPPGSSFPIGYNPADTQFDTFGLIGTGAGSRTTLCVGGVVLLSLVLSLLF